MPRKKGQPLDRMAWMREPTSKERSVSQEAKIAKHTGGVVQRGSGNTLGRKGDVDDVPDISLSLGTFKIEAKTTKHRSYSIKLSELNKIEMEAMADGKKGCMCVSLEDEYDYIVIRKEYLNFGGGGNT